MATTMATTGQKGIEHHFNGDGQLLNQTYVERGSVRQALAALQQALQRIEGVPTQITAEIKFNVSGPAPKEHIYTVSITDSQFDSNAFHRTKTPATRVPTAGAGSGSGTAASPPRSSHGDGRRESTVTETDGMDGRPAKRARIDGEESGLSASVSGDPVQTRLNEILTFVKGWHDEWTRQGGWLFDNLNGSTKLANDRKEAVEKRLDSVQDILGQSINSSNATTMAELSNVTKLLPWLEHCRKTNADKVQAREEKWRSSSATFHDLSRRDREAAEKRLEEKLEAQQRLLVKVAEANGIDVDEIADRRSRETSLGAQLTAELNLEAARAGEDREKVKNHSHHDAIRIDD